ncbi:MAG: GNAT family N-acetyltransferase [Anaerolineales bacterium]|nr:GNAT family N-acetyltransferase [Anaerolineales bacterium]
MPDISIRQATLADKPALFAFLRQAYPDRWQYKLPERWEWEFERNPFVRGPLPIWIALDGDRVVGQSCALVEPLIIHGQEHRVGWGVDFFVLPEYRGQGLGTHLQQANNAGNEIFMSLSMAQAAAHIKSKIGLSPLPPVPVWMKIIHHDPSSVLNTLTERTKLPEPLLRASGLPRLTASLLTARTARRDRKMIPPARGALTPVVTFGPAVDDLWARVSGQFSALIRRDAEYLNWKYVQQPHVQYERVLAPNGCIIFRRARPPERNAGLILDVFADPKDTDTLRTLLGHAIQRLTAQGVTYILTASSLPAVQKILAAWDFKQTKTVTPMIRANIPVPQEEWLLGKGDHDWDQFPLA